MGVADLCRRRSSIRAFTQEAVSDREREEITEAARWAATSNNRQARRFVMVEDPSRIRDMVDRASMQDFVGEAGLLVFGVATEKGGRGAIMDVVISMTQMEMAAVELGLGTIWLGSWDREVISEMLGVPGEMEVVVGMAIGHARDEGAPRDKLPHEVLFSWDRM